MPAPHYADLPPATRHYIDAASWNAIKTRLDALGQTGLPAFASLPTTTKPYIDQPSWDALIDEGGGGTGSGALISGSETLNFPSIPSGETADLSFTAAGVVAGQPLAIGAPPGLEAGLYVAAAWISAADTITIRLGNNLAGGDPVNPAAGNYTWVSGLVGTLSGSQALSSGSIPSGDPADLIITATGVTAGQPVSVGAPALLEDGICFAAWASNTSEITVRVTNNKADGTPVTMASRTWTWVVF